MKVICIGDPHFRVENIDEVNLFVEKLLQLVEEQKPNFVVVLGDLLHTHERLHTIPLNTAHDFIKALSKITETFVLVGNHDMIGNQQFLTTNHWMNAMKEWENVTIVDKVVKKKVDKYRFIFCPYVPPGRFQDALDTLDSDWKKSTCIFAHQEFAGCKMGAIISVGGDSWPEEYPYVVSGHIHDNQTPQKNIYYCGSSMQHSFGESGTNIIPVLTWKSHKEKYNLDERDLGLSKKQIVYTDIDHIPDAVVREGDNNIKLSIDGDFEEFKSFKKSKKYKELVKKGVKVVFKQKRKTVKLNNERLEKNLEHKDDDFHIILSKIVLDAKDPFVYQAYEYVVNNQIIAEDEVIII